MTRLFLVDKHEVAREGLKRMLELDPNYAVVGGARTGQEALAQIELTAPHVVILDFELTDCDALVFLAHLRQLHPQLPVLILA